MDIAERLHEKRAARIAAGREAFAELQKHEHYKQWVSVADALVAIREEAMDAAHTNVPQGPPYRAAFKKLIDQREAWAAGISESVRTHCYWLIDNLAAVTAWRETLTFEQRDNWNHPTTIKRQYERATKVKEPKQKGEELTPLQQARDKITELQELCDRLQRQLEQAQREGSLFDLRQDTARDIARVIRAHVGRDKRLQIAKLLREEQAPAG